MATKQTRSSGREAGAKTEVGFLPTFMIDRGKPIQSKLEPYFEVIVVTRRQRMTWGQIAARLQLVAGGDFREFCRTFGRLYDLVNKPLQKLLLTELQWIHKRCQALSGC